MNNISFLFLIIVFDFLHISLITIFEVNLFTLIALLGQEFMHVDPVHLFCKYE